MNRGTTVMASVYKTAGAAPMMATALIIVQLFLLGFITTLNRLLECFGPIRFYVQLSGSALLSKESHFVSRKMKILMEYGFALLLFCHGR